MCCATAEALAALDAATIGVFAFIGADGRPRACPVTPYVHAGAAVVSSTLAFTAKVAAVRTDPRVALLAGGCLIRARATVEIDVTRASIRIPLADCATVEGADRVTLTVTGDGLPSILTLDPATDPLATELPVPTDVEGPACVLFHQEDSKMADLRQLALHGTVSDRVFRVERRAGSLAPAGLGQLKMLRSLTRQARRKRPVFERWTRSPGR